MRRALLLFLLAGAACSGAEPAMVVPDPQVRCGDGKAAGVEQCDGSDLRGATCEALGFNAGTPVCLSSCLLDVRACETVELCHNGVDDDRDGDKDCDDPDCVSEGMCAVCGDGEVTANEQCDDGNSASGDCCDGCRAESGCEVEPNDERVEAVTLGGTAQAERSGHIATVGDVDLYVVTVPAGSTGTLIAESHPFDDGTTCSSDVDTLLEIRDAGGELVASDEDGGAGFCSRVTASGLAPGPIYVVVRASAFAPSGTLAYRVTTSLALAACGDGVRQAGQACDDGNTQSGDGCSSACRVEPRAEVEPNDVLATANGPFAVPFAIDAKVGDPGADNADHDVFAVELGAATRLVIETQILQASDCLELLAAPELRDASGALLAMSPGTGASSRSCGLLVTERALAPGRYYLEIAGRPAPASYRLLVTTP